MASVVVVLGSTRIQTSFSAWAEAAIMGTGWTMMVAMRRQRRMQHARKVLRAWGTVAREDKGALYLPLFAARVQVRVLREAWGAWEFQHSVAQQTREEDLKSRSPLLFSNVDVDTDTVDIDTSTRRHRHVDTDTDTNTGPPPPLLPLPGSQRMP